MAIIFGMINFWWQTLMVTLLNSNIVAKPQKSAPCKNMESKSGGKSLFMRWHRSGQTAGCIGIVLKPLITQCQGSSSVVKNFSFDKICTLEWIGHWGQAIISQPPLYAHCHQHHRHHFHHHYNRRHHQPWSSKEMPILSSVIFVNGWFITLITFSSSSPWSKLASQEEGKVVGKRCCFIKTNWKQPLLLLSDKHTPYLIHFFPAHNDFGQFFSPHSKKCVNFLPRWICDNQKPSND